VLSQLVTVVSQLRQTNINSSKVIDQLIPAVSLLQTAVSELEQNDAKSSNRSDHVLSQLMTVLSQSNNRTDQVLNQVMRAVSQLKQTDFNSSQRSRLYLGTLRGL